MNPISQLLTWFFADRPTTGKSLPDIAQMLQASARQVDDRIAAAADTPGSRFRLGHIIGIERWGARRLRVALGEPLEMDEMNGYMPNESTPLGIMRQDFADTRRATVALVHELEKRRVDPNKTVPHNQFGDYSVRQWLGYIYSHAGWDSRRLKR